MDVVACVRTLLQVALGGAGGPDPGRVLSTASDEAWREALDVAEVDGALAPLAHGLALRGLLELAPPAARSRFSAALVQQRAHDAARLDAYRALRVAGLDPLLLQNGALAARYHPHLPSSRPTGLHVLLEPARVPAACRVLERLDFRRGDQRQDSVDYRLRTPGVRATLSWALRPFEHLDLAAHDARPPASYPELGDVRVLRPAVAFAHLVQRLEAGRARGGYSLGLLLDLGLLSRREGAALTYPELEVALPARRDRCAALRAVEFLRRELGVPSPAGLQGVAAGLPAFSLEEVLRSRRLSAGAGWVRRVGAGPLRVGALWGDRRRERAALRQTP